LGLKNVSGETFYRADGENGSTTSLSASVISFIGHPRFNHVGTVDNRKPAEWAQTIALADKSHRSIGTEQNRGHANRT